MRFSRSNSRLPASTTVMLNPGFNSESFSARKAAEMPPPRMQISLSKRGIGSTSQGRRSASRILECAARVFADGGFISQVVRCRAVEIKAHQIDHDVFSFGDSRNVR